MGEGRGRLSRALAFIEEILDDLGQRLELEGLILHFDGTILRHAGGKSR